MTESETFLLVTKLAPIFLYPVGMVIVLTILGLLIAKRRMALTFFTVAAGWLCLASTPIFADWVIATLEYQYPARSVDELPKADVAIVLGGAISQPTPPRVEIDISGAFDRVFQAMKLYRAERADTVLVTGGKLPWHPDGIPEAELIRSFLVEWGNIPEDAIKIATESRNTYENALEIKALWEEEPFQSAFLITSAAHMPRAMAVFENMGLPVSAATTDIQALKGLPSTPLRWLPNVSALAITTQAVKEWIGYGVYWLRGYV